MPDAALEATIRDYLTREVFYDRDLKDLKATDSLLDKGLVDSLAILKIVTFCEETFGIQIPDADVLPDAFESVRSIATLVEKVRKA